MGQGATVRCVPGRRVLLRAGAAAVAMPLLGACSRHGAPDVLPPDVPGGFVGGASPERGHRLRERRKSGAPEAPAVTRRVATVIAGGGIAGLAAARALRLAGHDDFALLEQEDAAGGNSRAGKLLGSAGAAALPCPLGAHYLPVPPETARAVLDFLDECGVCRWELGRRVWDERYLCHSPQERVYYNSGDGPRWHPGLLPVDGMAPGTIEQYRRFGERIAALRASGAFRLPRLGLVHEPTHPAVLQPLDALSFSAWLDREGFDDRWLRAYLDYCCRDDYGAGITIVSARAGVHYFASRHGFAAPEDTGGDAERDAVLTWPEGNGWLAARLAARLGARLISGVTVERIGLRHGGGVEVDGWVHAHSRRERWLAARCVVALPVFVAARVLESPPPALLAYARRLRHAPWIVVNARLARALDDRPGAAPAWDNVVHGSAGLGYVSANHQALDPAPHASPQVITWYLAPGLDPATRQAVLTQPWQHWAGRMLAELGPAHPDLSGKLERVLVTRYGHAMAVPEPGIMGFFETTANRTAHEQLSNLNSFGPLRFAHADWAGYSIFEEAFSAGDRVVREWRSA